MQAYNEYHVPDEFPICYACDRLAMVVTFFSQQEFIATLTSDGLADDDHCEPFGLPEKIGDELFYCMQHAPRA